jgi:hypothetical protein
MARRALVPVILVLVLFAIVLVGARPYAAGWNDGSRLATVECFVDHHTLAIDDSIFVRPPGGDASRPNPYAPDLPFLAQYGTLDKLCIDGRYYSDKSPVPALLLACWYQAWEWCGGPLARLRPDLFCFWATVVSSGLAYLLAVLCVYLLARAIGLKRSRPLLLAGSLALATVALPYACSANNHVLLLGVTSALALALVYLARQRRPDWRCLVAVGGLTGLGYTIDLGVGPVLVATTGLLVAYRTRRARAIALFALAALPWLLLHHGVNYAVGGTFGPANSVAAHFQWPGCPFQPENMTGAWHHRGPGPFLLYSASMLFGKRGFVGHNLPLFLALPALVVLLRQAGPYRPEVGWAACFSTGTWLLYAAASNNSSGQCLSIRWFVPLLAPGYLVLALFLRDRPKYRADFLLLSAWGALFVALVGAQPWGEPPALLFWLVQASALLSWGALAFLRHRQAAPSVVPIIPHYRRPVLSVAHAQTAPTSRAA